MRERIVGLRHDIDNVYGLRRGLPKVISIEKKYGVKSTFFVRTDIVLSVEDYVLLRQTEKDGWEIGLHLINTINDPNKLSPKDELNFLKETVGVKIHGVTPCGQTIGFKGEITWKNMDSLGLEYMEGYGTPKVKVETIVIPTHLSFDIFYIAKFGERKGYQRFKEDLSLRLNRGVATVLTHPEWFVKAVGVRDLKRIVLTLMRKRMMNDVYNRFIYEFKDQVQFLSYANLKSYLREGDS